MNKLIENIWGKHHDKPIPKKLHDEILKKAENSFAKSKGEYKLSTFISWFARQSATKKLK